MVILSGTGVRKQTEVKRYRYYVITVGRRHRNPRTVHVNIKRRMYNNRLRLMVISPKGFRTVYYAKEFNELLASCLLVVDAPGAGCIV